MNGTERKAKSRIAEKIGLVAAPRGYVSPSVAEAINVFIKAANELIQAEKETK